MKKKIPEIRKHKFAEQGGRCYYCDQPMWADHADRFAEQYRLKPKSARKFQATAEHLLAQCEGGKDNAENIVAACLFCNQTRHKRRRPLSPKAYRQEVRSRLAVGKWHGFFPHLGLHQKKLDPGSSPG